MDEKEIQQVPQEKWWDYVERVAKAGTSMIPIAGGPVSEAVDLLYGFLPISITKRRDRFLGMVYDRLVYIERNTENFNPADLAQNEQFITTLLNALQIAIREHREEKMEYLKNAVTNTAIGVDLDSELSHIFLSYIDAMSIYHIIILRYLSDITLLLELFGRDNYALGRAALGDKYFGGEFISALTDRYKDLNMETIQFICSDLIYRGLIDNDIIDMQLKDHFGFTKSPVGGTRMIKEIVTDLGKRFLQFISSPSIKGD